MSRHTKRLREHIHGCIAAHTEVCQVLEAIGSGADASADGETKVERLEVLLPGVCADARTLERECDAIYALLARLEITAPPLPITALRRSLETVLVYVSVGQIERALTLVLANLADWLAQLASIHATLALALEPLGFDLCEESE